MRNIIATVLIASCCACGSNPTMMLVTDPCHGDGVDYCAELLATCANPYADAFTCRAIVADDDWCACHDALEEGSEQQ